jgi:hypothetical protein
MFLKLLKTFPRVYKRNVVPTLIHAYSTVALEPTPPPLIQLNNKLILCKTLQEAEHTFAEILSQDMTPNHITYIFLMDQYIRHNELDSALKLFRKVSSERGDVLFDIPTFKNLVKLFIKKKRLYDCFVFLQECENKKLLSPYYELYVPLYVAAAKARKSFCEDIEMHVHMIGQWEEFEQHEDIQEVRGEDETDDIDLEDDPFGGGYEE